MFEKVSDQQNIILIERFSIEEIDDILGHCDGDKSLGPDGFNFSFFKSCWYLLKENVFQMFLEFYSNARLPKCLSSNFLTLVPKMSSPQGLGDFRPISLLGSLYKLLSKVLAARLAKVIDSIISHNQSAFIKRRHIADEVVELNELIDLARKRGRRRVIFKVDFEKGYDSVSWDFLDYMLIRFGFHEKWRSWIRACVFSGKLSVLVNGSSTEEVNIKRGLKQGDPLAPYLFVLVTKGLSGLVRNAVSSGNFKGFQVGSSDISISHL